MTANQRAHWSAMVDLYTWEVETRRRLPTYAARIAEIERAGGVVDLETGEVFYPKGEEEREPDSVPEL